MKKISRRSFLMATGVIAASAALSACGGSSASTSSAGSTAASTAASGTAAQGGGDLVIYSPNSEGLLNATIPVRGKVRRQCRADPGRYRRAGQAHPVREE
ncbi:MAG: hypothetical protein ACLUIR_04545 [Faecalibacterium prausnitzii]